MVPTRQIRASFTADTITVYQAYSPAIAGPALRAGRFVPPFKHSRMTWIKPSFLWMMYRSGWATRPGQERILAIDLHRDGFAWALDHACLSHFDPDRHPDRPTWARLLRASPVRIQWDPERSLRLAPLPYRAIQVGLAGPAVDRYVDQWTAAIVDVTDTVHRIHRLIQDGDEQAATALLPVEHPYPVSEPVAAALGADPGRP